MVFPAAARMRRQHRLSPPGVRVSRLFATLMMAPILTTASIRTLASLPKAQIVATAVDQSGAVYATGTISSADLPVTPGAFQSQYHATTCSWPQWSFPCPDGFVVKFNAAGQLVYATYLGGDGADRPAAIAVDEAGNAYVAGATFSSNFPLTDNRLADNSPVGGFVAKITALGTGLVYSTRLPGVALTSAIAVDGLHRAHIAGNAAGPGLPVTPGAIQTQFHGAAGYGDGVVLKLSARGEDRKGVG